MEGRRRRALLALLALLSCRVEAEDIVVGCGGFVKSDVEINYSLIEIKLYTKQGTLKYQTDCAPNNGYFMIPLYDKGDFILKIEPPFGWSFEPTNVDLHVDGINDICTKGEDINFVFTGFSVSGKVLSKGQISGPAGVHVNLRKVGRDVDQTSLTQTGGKYVFTKVLPGDYEIFASHPTWTLQKASTSVQVINSNANTVDSLVVAGYEVLGSVRSDGEPMKGVVFLLFSSSVAKQDISGCNSSPVEGFQTADEASSFLCSVLSGEDGSFIFPSLPSGEYTVVPFYRGERITFDVAPSRLDFSVAHNSLRIEPVFRVMGFSVTGRVLDGPNGRGVRYATVVLSNQIKVTTKADGSFRLENMTAGTYTINTQKEHIFFEPVTVKIAPNTPQLADIVATSFSVCGHVAVKRFPEGLKQIIKYKLAMVAQSKDKASPIITETDSRGLFCFQARAGTYVIQVMVSENEAKAGLALKPKFQTVTVKNAPIMDLSFTQFMASVTGKVVCLDSCGNLAVTLQPLSRHSDKQSVQLSAGVDSVLFTFNDILPGKYKVNIVHEEWCWKNRSVELEVVDQDVAGIEFKQTGYMLRCSLSHAITLEFYQDGSGPENVGVYNLTKGVNRFCLSKPGVYKVTPRSCHQFEHEYYIYDTAAPTILTLTAIRHRAQGAIVTDKLMDVTVTIRSSIDSEPALVLGPLKSLQEQRQEQQLAEIEARRLEREKKGQQVEREPPAQEIVEDLEGPFGYEFSYWARAGEKITVTPSSKELLFYPPSVEALITGDTCPGRLIEIQGKAGLFLEGQIHPTLEGVEIIIIEKTSKPLITVFTNEEGSYRVGPLHRDQEYSVTAQKEGFVLTALEGTLGDFKAFALAGVTFEIKTEDDQPLAGVLLSLSGGQFRSNLLTQENGMLTFANLSPGQYYFKPMMKEFRFEPASQMIEIQEGQTLKIKITGYRTAYSCYGQVSSLNGEPEQGVSVEAVGQEDCSIYGEDTVTDEDGKFRLRGLLPSCVYHIQLKADGNDHIERALPQFRAVQVDSSDIDGVNILAFRQINQFDLSGNVITSPEHLSTLRVVLYKSENLDNPIQTVSLGQSLFFHFPPLLRDGENYVVVLESTLPKSLHEYILPQISFSATGYHKHITLMFTPSRKLPEQDVAQGSYIALPLTLLLLLAGYNHDKLIPLLMQLVNRLQGVRVLSQGGLDGVSQEEAKRQAKRLKTRRT
ncbi:nodal modulator 1 [Scyliorhinus canicula]|uniref:nodal modulator 1 n=1 Tax=Scyliorhinus canicula TaxID=7830 RepID=UPI0018F6EA1F|nr:nodal modulator 1 [Scyliorhinus canicula]